MASRSSDHIYLFCNLRFHSGTFMRINRAQAFNLNINIFLTPNMNWYYVDLGKQAGPVSDGQLEELARGGKINADTLVWHEGMAAWLPYREAKGGSNPASPGTAAGINPPVGENPEAVCAECGKIFPIQDMIRYGKVCVCANCKPVFMQKLSEGAQIQTGELNYAGFGIRFGAKFLDGLILGLPFMAVFFIVAVPQVRNVTPGRVNFLPLLMQLGFIVVRMAYDIFFLGKYGATPGKMLCKLKVVTADGGRIGYGRATGRFFAEMLSGMICYIGYIMVAFDNPQKRALHDHICNTRVVYK
jgi:uncharacterized RDD family membrane protein YckC